MTKEERIEIEKLYKRTKKRYIRSHSFTLSDKASVTFFLMFGVLYFFGFLWMLLAWIFSTTIFTVIDGFLYGRLSKAFELEQGTLDQWLRYASDFEEGREVNFALKPLPHEVRLKIEEIIDMEEVDLENELEQGK